MVNTIKNIWKFKKNGKSVFQEYLSLMVKKPKSRIYYYIIYRNII
jgi:hypothetical protein